MVKLLMLWCLVILLRYFNKNVLMFWFCYMLWMIKVIFVRLVLGLRKYWLMVMICLLCALGSVLMIVILLWWLMYIKFWIFFCENCFIGAMKW